MGYIVVILVCVIVLLVLLMIDILNELNDVKEKSKTWERLYTNYRELVDRHFSKY